MRTTGVTFAITIIAYLYMPVAVFSESRLKLQFSRYQVKTPKCRFPLTGLALFIFFFIPNVHLNPKIERVKIEEMDSFSNDNVNPTFFFYMLMFRYPRICLPACNLQLPSYIPVSLST